jgi:hypothetical protein
MLKLANAVDVVEAVPTDAPLRYIAAAFDAVRVHIVEPRELAVATLIPGDAASFTLHRPTFPVNHGTACVRVVPL